MARTIMGFPHHPSIEQLRRYKEALAKKRPEDEPVYKHLELAKQTTWLALLVLLFLIYYLIDIMNQTMDLLIDKF